MARLQTYYRDQVIAELSRRFSYKTPMQAPRIIKITLNMGLGGAVADKKVIENAMQDMTRISGQKPIVCKARKSVANFKVREGWPIGCKATLRRERMYEFLDRLISIAIPRIRDFRGLNARAFDGRGNYNMGVKEQIIFPEIDYDKIDALRGMNITITTSARTDEEGRALLAPKLFHQPQQPGPQRLIQHRGGLVGQDQSRPCDDGAGEGHALALTAGQRSHGAS